MKSELKTTTVASKTLGRKVKMREMSAAGQIALTDASAEGAGNLRQAALTCKHCVIEWQDSTVDEILEAIKMATLVELSQIAVDISGGAESKNSEAGQAADSHSASVSH